MLRAWVLHKVQSCCLAFALLLAVCVPLAIAQQTPKPRASRAPWLIILPLKIVAGAQATLAVLDRQGRLLPDVIVEFNGGQKVTTDVTGRALFKAPGQPGTLTARVFDRKIVASTLVIAPQDPGPQVTSEGHPAGVDVISYPHVLTLHDRFSLEGSGFRGAADLNRVYLNGDPCFILASSPVSLVALPGPRVPIGDVSLQVTVAGIDAGHFPVAAVLLEFSGPTEAVDAGATGTLILRARGTTEPLLLEVRNGSPGVIELSNGNVQRLKTSGGDDNVAPVEVKFMTGGNYTVSARLLSTNKSQPQSGISQKASDRAAENRIR